MISRRSLLALPFLAPLVRLLGKKPAPPVNFVGFSQPYRFGDHVLMKRGELDAATVEDCFTDGKYPYSVDHVDSTYRCPCGQCTSSIGFIDSRTFVPGVWKLRRNAEGFSS